MQSSALDAALSAQHCSSVARKQTMASLDDNHYTLLPEERAEASAARAARKYYCTMAALNFFETGAGAGLVKFSPLFLAARGLNTGQVGVVLALSMVAKFVGGLVFGRLADATNGVEISPRRASRKASI